MNDFTFTNFLFLLVPLVLLDLILKGLALWKAGNNRQGVWFFFLFIVNSLGILSLVYLVFFSGKKEKLE